MISETKIYYLTILGFANNSTLSVSIMSMAYFFEQIRFCIHCQSESIQLPDRGYIYHFDNNCNVRWSSRHLEERRPPLKKVFFLVQRVADFFNFFNFFIFFKIFLKVLKSLTPPPKQKNPTFFKGWPEVGLTRSCPTCCRMDYVRPLLLLATNV